MPVTMAPCTMVNSTMTGSMEIIPPAASISGMQRPSAWDLTEKRLHPPSIQKEIQEIIVTSGVLQALPASGTLKKVDAKSADAPAASLQPPAEPEMGHSHEKASHSTPTIPAKATEPKSGLLKFVAYCLTVCLVGIGLYFLYTEGYLNHLLPKNYQLQPTLNIPAAAEPAAVKSDSSIRIKTAHAVIKKYTYLLTVRISQKEYDADSRLKQLELQGFYGRIEKSSRLIGGKRWYEVKLGPYSARDTAAANAQRFKATFGYPPTEDSIRIR